MAIIDKTQRARLRDVWHPEPIFSEWQDEEKWPQVHEALVSAMIRLEKALRPHLKNL
jgi:hypothetical protein